MKKSNGAALLMEMGTGKTLTAIAITGALWQTGRARRVLIVAPLSIVGVWREEFEKYTDYDYSLAVLTGSATAKRKALDGIQGGGIQVAVVNYESAWRMEKELRAFDADLILCDEGHMCGFPAKRKQCSARWPHR